jgi:hypothetical protein
MNTNSNVKFYLQMKKKYDSIENYLTNIISEYDDLINLLNYKNLDTEYLREFLEDYNNKKNEVLLLKKQINDQLLSCCDHEFVKDTVDCGLDSSYNIEYCLKCECNKE